MTKIKYMLLIIPLMQFVGCDKENNSEMCNVNAPLTELNWLANEIESIEEKESLAATIFYCTYSTGQQGFYIDKCINCVKWARWAYYDCEGNVLCGYDRTLNYDEAFSCIDSFEVVTQEIIWEYTPAPEP